MQSVALLVMLPSVVSNGALPSHGLYRSPYPASRKFWSQAKLPPIQEPCPIQLSLKHAGVSLGFHL